MLAALKEYWSKHPDLRLGQIVSNMTLVGHAPGPGIFSIEDHVLLGRLTHTNLMPAQKRRAKKPILWAVEWLERDNNVWHEVVLSAKVKANEFLARMAFNELDVYDNRLVKISSRGRRTVVAMKPATKPTGFWPRGLRSFP